LQQITAFPTILMSGSGRTRAWLNAVDLCHGAWQAGGSEEELKAFLGLLTP